MFSHPLLVEAIYTVMQIYPWPFRGHRQTLAGWHMNSYSVCDVWKHSGCGSWSLDPIRGETNETDAINTAMMEKQKKLFNWVKILEGWLHEKDTDGLSCHVLKQAESDVK